MSQESKLFGKTVWTFKHAVETDLTNENVEVILNFYEDTKYEINMNRFYSEMYSNF